MNNPVENWEWSEWLPFPDPRNRGILKAPYGPGLYQLKNVDSGEYILFGKGKNLAYRMSSILPAPLGQGTRNNKNKREYVLQNLKYIQYRTLGLSDSSSLKELELELRNCQEYRFKS